jgi:hypothetical protein
MKKINYIIGILLLVVLSISCDKDSENISFRTDYPVLVMTGDALIVINKGDAYAEPGILATIGEEETEVTTVGSVDPNTPNIYKIDYSAVNADGFSASTTRYVIVMDPATTAGNDFTGTYERTFYNVARSGTFSDWEMTSTPGVYTVTDVGGVDAADYEYGLTVYNVTGNFIVFPVQANALGGNIFATSTSGGTTPDLIEMGVDGVYLWSVKGAGYGTALRTLERR